MGLTENAHELLSILVMGFSTLLVFNGYDTQTFVVESVLHSVSEREPGRIDNHAGYFGQTVLYFAYTVSTLFAPWVCYRFGSRWALFVGSVFFTIYLTGFLFLNSYFYYFSDVLIGIGFALYYCGQGAYVSEHSTAATISRNSVLVSAIGNSSMLMGGMVLVIIFTFNNFGATQFSEGGHIYRSFSDNEIFIIYGVLAVFSAISNIGFFCLPTKQNDTSLAKINPHDHSTLKTQLIHIFNTVKEVRFLCLIPFFVFYGTHISFWILAFPTTFSFSKALAGNPLIVAYYSISLGIGNIVVGSYIHVMSKKNPSFGLMPTMFTQICIALVVYILTIIFTPIDSSIGPSSLSGLFADPTVVTCIIAGLLHGMVDCCSCTMRSIICTIALPEKRLQCYAAAKLFQSLASCFGCYLAAYLNIYHWLVYLAGLQALSATGFYLVTRMIKDNTPAKVEDLKVKNDIEI